MFTKNLRIKRLESETIASLQSITFSESNLDELIRNLTPNFYYFATQVVLHDLSTLCGVNEVRKPLEKKILLFEQETLVFKANYLLRLYKKSVGNTKDPNELIKIAEKIAPKVKKGLRDYEIIFQFIGKVIYLCNFYLHSNTYNLKPIWEQVYPNLTKNETNI